jgi:hypothetical protein
MRRGVFSAELTMRRSELLRSAARRLAAEVDASITALVELRDGEESGPAIRLKAALGLIDRAAQLHDLVETSPKLAAMQYQLDELERKR